MRAPVHWETVLGYFTATPFGAPDPLFGYDLSFFVFVLPLWRLVHGWAITLVTATIVLTVAIYVLERGLVRTSRGPRLAAGARSHLLVLAALALGLKAIGFWLDRFELVFSPRGIVFGAAYTDIYASLPVLGALAVFAALCAVACLAQIARAGLRLGAGGPVPAGPG